MWTLAFLWYGFGGNFIANMDIFDSWASRFGRHEKPRMRTKTANENN